MSSRHGEFNAGTDRFIILARQCTAMSVTSSRTDLRLWKSSGAGRFTSGMRKTCKRIHLHLMSMFLYCNYKFIVIKATAMLTTARIRYFPLDDNYVLGSGTV
jgi:hypothetical protein